MLNQINIEFKTFIYINIIPERRLPLVCDDKRPARRSATGGGASGMGDNAETAVERPGAIAKEKGTFKMTVEIRKNILYYRRH